MHLRVKQGSTEWHELRRGRVTATGFKNFLTPKKYQLKATRTEYAIQLALERFRIEDEPPFETEWMRRGLELEPYAVEAYEAQTGVKTELAGFISADHENPTVSKFVGCSPDRLVGAWGLLEIKCPKNKTLVNYCVTDETPPEYYLQCQAQLWITGRKWCDLFAWSPDLEKGYRALIEPDEAAFRAFDKNVPLFLEELETEAVAMVEFLEPASGQGVPG